MKKIILILLTGLFFLFSAAAFAQESRFYKINLISSQGKLELKDITVLPGAISTVPNEGAYQYDLLSFTGLSLFSDHFNVLPSTRSVRVFDTETGESTSEIIKEDNVRIVLGIPYFPNGKEIEVYDPENKKILTISVEHFAEITPSPTPVFNPTLAEDNEGGNILLYIGLGALGSGLAYAAYLFWQSRRKDNQL